MKNGPILYLLRTFRSVELLRQAILTAVLFVVASSITHAGSATWNANPITGDWNTAGNWMPNTVPNGSADTATFAVSNTVDVSLSRNTMVEGIVFNPAASAFTIKTSPAQSLTISGSGIVNNSGVMQNFATAFNDSTMTQDIVFTNGASAGSLTLFTNYGSAGEGRGRTRFFDSSTAADSTFINIGLPFQGIGGRTEFHDSSTAGNGSFTNEAGGNPGGTTEFYDSATAGTATFTTVAGEFGGGFVKFNDTSSAANGTFMTNGAASNEESFGGDALFFDSSTADRGTFIINGATALGAGGGELTFDDSSTASNATLIVNGPTVAGGAEGEISFFGDATAANATIIINGGEGVGGDCVFGGSSGSGTPRIEVFGNGTLNIFVLNHQLTVGSIEGDGNIVIQAFETLVVGSNNLDAVFSGEIRNFDLGRPASLTKIGTGRLTLSGANTYTSRTTGRTTMSEGELIVDNTTGSGTGSGKVQVDAGTLGGSGTINGAVTIGTGGGLGAFLTPGLGTSKATTLTIQSELTCKADSTYTCRLITRKTKADQVAANGVTIEIGAQFNFKVRGDKKLRPGKAVTAISNTSANPIAGVFANLPDDSTLSVGANTFQIDYQGGDGNDLTLTVVP